MPFRSSQNRWGYGALFFHWTVALLIAAQIVIGLYMVNLPPSIAKIKIFLLHKSLGITLLVLVLLRLAWRFFDTPPKLPAALPSWQLRAARLNHFTLYVVMLLMPISGWIFNSASGFPLPWFNLFQLPTIAPVSKPLAAIALLTHQTLFWTLTGLLGLHIGAALDHHWRQHDGVLRQMLPWHSSKRDSP